MQVAISFIVLAPIFYLIATFFASIEINPFYRLYYIFAWYSYIFFIDGIIYVIKKDSLIISRTKEFIYMLFLSTGLWFVFELFNLSLQNWYYIMLPYDSKTRYIGYILSYATVLPAIFETMELIETIKIFKKIKLNIKINPPSEKTLNRLVYVGIFSLLITLLLPKIFFPLIWVSFIFIFEPLCYIKGIRSLIREILSKNYSKILSILFAGIICGILWEMWNFKAGAKWIYNLPYLNKPKIFEMPLAGYLGFPFFAIECYCIYNFLSYYKKGITWEEDTQTPLSLPDFKYFYYFLIPIILIIIIVSINLIDKYTVKIFTIS